MLFCALFTRISVRFCGIRTPLTPPSNCFADEVKFPLRFIFCRSYTPLISFAANVKLYSSTFYPACLKTCCFVALEAILDYKTCSFEGNSSLFPARVMPCFTTRVAFSLCGQSYYTLLSVHFTLICPATNV